MTRASAWRIGRLPLVALAYLAGLLAIAWAGAAIWIDGPSTRWLAAVLTVAVVVAGLAMSILLSGVHAAMALVMLIGFVALWWSSIPPRHDRDWLPDVAQLPTATIDGSRITVHNVRNFDYRSSDTDFVERWETRTYDLHDLRGVDMFLSFWGSPHIAHTIASWDFGDGKHLAISIETRKEKGESYSAVLGFFRQYELYYVVADERDVIGVRASHRGEQLYLYHIRTAPEPARAILLEYLAQVNALAAQPRWYNALTHNCTTVIRDNVRRVMAVQPWSWQILLNGHIDELWARRGVIDTSLPFAELKARSDITERAKAAAGAPDFSARIRAGLPGMWPGEDRQD
jgi:hypothetical protein